MAPIVVRNRQVITTPIINTHLYVIACDQDPDCHDGTLGIVTHIYPDDPSAFLFIGKNVVDNELGEWGCYTEYISLDYTEHIRKVIAASRIQNTWRRHRRDLAAKSIQRAWRNWIYKRDILWNPYTFVGLVNMVMMYNRTVTESAA